MANTLITTTQSIVNWFRKEPNNMQYYGTSSNNLYESFNRRTTSQQSVIDAIYNRVAVDAASVPIKHVRTTPEGYYAADMPTLLNKVLTIRPNLDQTPQAFMIDAVIFMFKEGQVALIPETTGNPYETNEWDVASLRVARIIGYKPQTIDVEVYNEQTGKTEDWTVPKEFVAIIENPLFYIMNKPNATLKRLTRAIALLDQANDEAVSGKIDLIIHVPYTIRSETRTKIAEKRRKDIEEQLKNSKYGIAYMDPTETVTQLNRPASNNLLEQYTTLLTQAYAQIGITDAILNGTADQQTMINYRSRILGMVLKAFTQEMKSKFLTPAARGKLQSIMYLFDPFEYSTVQEKTTMAGTLRTNEIASADEVRGLMYNLAPADTPKSTALDNPNINSGTPPDPTIPDETVTEPVVA